MPHKIAALSLSLALLVIAPHFSLADSPPAPISLTTLDGKNIKPLESKQNESGKNKPSVIIFITSDCPIANALAPEINRLYQHYHALGIPFTLAHVDPEISTAKAKKHAKDYSLKPPIVIDRKHQLVKISQASVTPQCAVFNHNGQLVYSGRINNQWTDYGKRRARPTEHNLRDTLDALLSGKAPPTDHTTAIGCYIPDLN